MTGGGRVVIAGGSGFLGQSLARYLAGRGRDVVVLSRHAPPGGGAGRHARWDARTVGDWWRALDGADALVNLAGRSVDCVKTPDRCDEILRSRVESTRALGRALDRVAAPPRVWVQMSTAHIYGDPPDLLCDEDSAFGYGLAPSIARAWEQALAEAAPAAIRSVVLRTSFVLGRGGGALRRLAALARGGLGGRAGSGGQGISWIHELDMNRLFERAILDDRTAGAYIATAPHPVSNAVFMRELRRAVGAPFGLPAAGWMVRLAAPILLRTDPDLASTGGTACPAACAKKGSSSASRSCARRFEISGLPADVRPADPRRPDPALPVPPLLRGRGTAAWLDMLQDEHYARAVAFTSWGVLLSIN